MNRKGQILIPILMLIIISVIAVSGIVMFTSQLVSMNLARGYLAKAVYAA